jgi:type I restriction enzyme R subunit
MAAHHEIKFEEYVTEQLVQRGWLEGSPERYDKQRALYPEDVLDWVRASQPEIWAELEKRHGARTGEAVLDRLEKSLSSKTGGTIEVLRNGFRLAGAGEIKMSQRAPEDARNALVNRRYALNRLRVVRQLKYCPTREWAIDLVFFINGIPVSTVELKTDFTQSVESAVSQYKTDRLPKDPQTKRVEPLLSFKRGAVVHFAMSDSAIEMTTKLAGADTFFLPFNKGNAGHAGNAPRADGEYPVAYFWEEICEPDTWLRIFHSFVYVEKKDAVDASGRAIKKETQIFPRYHQLEAVNTMISDAHEHGAGRQYLCEHSAGSGKTATIAWTAHDLIRLRSPEGVAQFDSVLIVTDRTVLDSQLQDAVQQLDHQVGVIRTIDREKSNLPKSQQLAEALLAGTPIIVVTIQTFPFALEAIISHQSLQSRQFAVIIDEAHTSQTGSTAKGLRAALCLDSAETLEKMTVEELLAAAQKQRVMPPNVSHFAFTATPKHSTYTLFGRPKNPAEPASKENPPEAFHRYTQRQAIEEGFILDVMAGYLPYKTAFKLGEMAHLEDKRVDQRMARRALAKAIALHPTHVTKKVDFIVAHFQKNVAHLLGGKAKAMVVASGRAQAVKYKLAFDRYAKQHPNAGLNVLVAFSGKVPGKELGKEDQQDPLGIDWDKEYTEANLNPLVREELRYAFERTENRIMLVANKFQTGFNQPKLVAMYLDKKVSGVEAVQTLSRLNRTYAGKSNTFVIDFVNEPDEIKAAFLKYDEGAELLDVQDVNVVYDMIDQLDDANIYNSHDVAQFKDLRGKMILHPKKGDALHKKLYAATQRPADVFNTQLKELNELVRLWEQKQDQAELAADQDFAESKASEYRKERESLMRFKGDLSKFGRVYNYVAQLIYFNDPALENFAAFAYLLSRRLKGLTLEQVDVSALLVEECKINSYPDHETNAQQQGLKPLTVNEADANDRSREFLSEIIRRLNEIFGEVGDQTGHENFTRSSLRRICENPVVLEQVAQNEKTVALQGDIGPAVRQAVTQSLLTEGEIAQTLLQDKQVMTAFTGIIYDLLKTENAWRV